MAEGDTTATTPTTTPRVTTKLSDMPIVDKIATAAIVLRALELNDFVNSGVMARDARLDEFLSSELGGKVISLRHVNPVAVEEPDIVSDDPSVESMPRKLGGGECQAVRQSLHQSWSAMDLVANLNGTDPLGVATSGIGEYWNSVLSLRLLASLKGIVAADLAGNSEMTVDISGGTGAAALFSADAFIDAQGTLGDRAQQLTAIAVHSVVYNTMLKQDLIDFVRDSEGRLALPSYMGLRVIRDDAMTCVPRSGDTPAKYYSYLFGGGAVALGVGGARVPFEIERKPSAGNGGGEEIVHSRLEWVIHPLGYSFSKTSTPTITELETAANWTRKYDRKRIPLAALITAG